MAKYLDWSLAMEVLGSKHSLLAGFFRNSVHPAWNEYPALFRLRAEHDEDGEEEE